MKTPIQTLASRFGLSYRQLADFLSVHRSMLSHINNGTKLLPNNCMVQLRHLMALDLSNCRAAKRISVRMTTKEPDAETIALIESRVQSFEIKLRISQNQLALLKQQWQQCIKTAAFCASLQEQVPALNTKQKRWLEELQYRNGKMQLRCSPDQQMLLTLELRALKAQHYVYRRAIVIKNQINNP